MNEPGRHSRAGEEARWMARVLAGEAEAFEPLVRAHAPMVRAMILQRLGPGSHVDDVAQDVFLKAYLALPRFRGASTFSTWLYRLTVNACWDVLRRRKQTAEVPWEELSEAERGAALGTGIDPEAERDIEDARRARQAALHRAMGSLSRIQREILTLREIEGRTYDEIAEILGLPQGTVESRLFRSRRALQDAVSALQAGPL